jgi:hypothetical protein
MVFSMAFLRSTEDIKKEASFLNEGISGNLVDSIHFTLVSDAAVRNARFDQDNNSISSKFSHTSQT